MSDFQLWMDREDSKKKLSDIDPDDMDEAVSMIYNLHEDCLCMRDKMTEVETSYKEVQHINDALQSRVFRLHKSLSAYVHLHKIGVFNASVEDFSALDGAKDVLAETMEQSLELSAEQQINAIDKILSTRLLYMYDRSDVVDLYEAGMRADLNVMFKFITDRQESLGQDFQKVIDDNIDDLYIE